MEHKNFIHAIIDEIALEGLDGITLQGLWLRLENRKDFGLKPIVEKVKLLIWEILIKARNVEFFLLNEPRDLLEVINRFAYVDEQGNFCEPPHVDRIYPHFPVTDDAKGIMGSCEHYYTRKRFSVRGVTLDDALNHGDCLIVVADQRTRRTALCGTDRSPLLEMNINNYCMLERVGRGRYNGDITHGKCGLQVISSDSKMLFYYRKCLLKHGLVTSQNFHVKVKTHNFVGKIIHLKRFYVELKSKHASDADKIIEHLRQQPEHFMLYKDVVKFDLKADMRKILQKHSKAIVTELVPYRKAFPDAPRSQWKVKTSDKEKMVRVVRLVESALRDEDEEEEDEEENGILDEGSRLVAVPLLRQGYLALEARGTQGLSQVALGTQLGLTSLQGRSICKLLKKHKLCETMPNDIGRQRVTLFYCKKFETLKHSMPSAIADEKSRLMQIVNAENDIKIPESIKRRERPVLPSEQQPPRKLRKVGRSFDEDYEPRKIMLKKPSREEIESIKTDIEVSEAVTAKNVTLPTLLDGKSDKNVSGMSNNNLTLRILKRAGLILQAVKALKVIQDPQKLQRMINEEEELEGFNYTIDRKTVLRLIEKLKADGHLKVIKVTLKGFGKEKVITFICHPTISPNHHEIQAAIEQAKMKLPIITKEALDKSLHENSELAEKLIVDHRIAKLQYGYKPKFVRLRTLHFFIYYLVYGYSGNENINQNIKHSMVENLKLDPNIVEEMGRVYQDQVDWKMFIPPLPENNDYPPGWVLVSDLLVRLPLFVFVSVINVTYNIPRLVEYLEHPIRKYYLVKDLPTDIYHLLTIMRKYLFTIGDIINQLAYIGLIQYGPQVLKEKDQVFIYVNRNAKLLDTTTSDFGYNHVTKKDYEEKRYRFDTSVILEQYWSDLWRFAMNTKLGVRNNLTGTTVVVESIYTKKLMLEALKAKLPIDSMAADVGYLPGDNLGAGGLDSDLFVHLKRNWYWTHAATPNVKARNELSISDTANAAPPKKSSKRKSGNPRKVMKNADDEIIKRIADNSKQVLQIESKKKERKHRKQTRIVKARPIKARKPWYDQKDREALMRMKKLRVDWTPAEDNVLLLCKVGQIFMSYNVKSNVLRNFAVVREILYQQIGEAAMNKTSRACQRRVSYMMKSEQTVNSVDMCLEELRQDDDLVVRYGPGAVISKQKMARENKLSPENEIQIMYTEFINLLLARLKSLTDMKSLHSSCILPDSITDFYTHFCVTAPRGFKRILRDGLPEVQNIVDIMCSVVNSVIHSSLASSHDKTNYSHQLFYIYQQYPDKLLRSVMTKCRSMGMVSLKKCGKRGDPHLPINMSPFKLSLNYVYYLHTKFEYPIFYGCFCSYSKLIEMSSTNSIEEITLNHGGDCASLVELYCAGLLKLCLVFPEQVIVLDPKLAETEEQYQQIVKRFKHLIANATMRKEVKKKHPAETDIEEDDMVICKDEDYNSFLTTSNGLASAASRLALFMRDDTITIDNNLQHAHDYFVINPCRIRADFSGDNTVLNSLFADQTVKNSILDRLKAEAVVSQGDAPDPDENEMPIVQFVMSKKELGATTTDIKNIFGRECVAILDSVLSKGILYSVGVVSLRIVHKKFLKPWVAKSYNLPRSKRDALGPAPTIPQRRKRGRPPTRPIETAQIPETQILIKPWIRVDGTVNRRVLDRMLGSVLGHVLANPGITLASLETRFVPMLQQGHTKALVDVLAEMGCLTKKIIIRPKTNLWSSRVSTALLEANKLDQPAQVCLLPDSMAIIKLGLFIGNKAYASDYLQNYVDQFHSGLH